MRSRLYFCVGLIIILFSVSSAFAQSLQDISDYEFEKYAVEKGTSMNEINLVFQDRFGYLWLGSQSGLDRFDGYEFKNYANILSDSSTTSLQYVNAIAEDSKGNMWASDAQGNVSSFRRFENRWINYQITYKDSLKNAESEDLRFYPQPRSIAISDDDRYAYVACFGLGLIRIDSETGEQKLYENDLEYAKEKDNKYAYRMLEKIEWLDADRLLVATGNGLRIFDTRTESYTQNYFKITGIENKEDYVNARIWARDFQVIDSNHLWISTEKGLYLGNLEKNSLRHFVHDPRNRNSLASNDLYEIYLDKENDQLWINVQNVGIDIMDTKSYDFIHLNESNSSLIGESFNNIIKDDQKNVWIASMTDGVLKYDPGKRKFKPLTKDSPKDLNLGFSSVWGTFTDSDKNLWVGSLDPGGGVLQLDIKNKKKKLYLKEDADYTIRYTITEDNNKGIWVFDDYYYVYLKKKGEKDFTFLGDFDKIKKDDCEYNWFKDFYLTSSGDLIHGTVKTTWIADKEGNVKLEEYKRITNLFPETINGFTRKNSEQTYVFTENSVWLWNEKDDTVEDLLPNAKEKLSQSNENAQYPATVVGNIAYLATYGNGMLYINLENEEIGFITTNEGLPNMYLYSTHSDDNGNLWMSSNYGIIKYNIKTKAVRNYTPIDGVQDFEFNGKSSHQSSDGLISMGGLFGVNYFDPDAIVETSSAPKVIIQKISIGAKEYNLDSKDNINYQDIEFKDNSLAFEYVAFSYRNPENNGYRYKMEGFDGDWVEAGNRRFVSYSNLPIGSFIFRVQGSNDEGIWNKEGATYRITILAPWYRTYTAYASYLILFIIGINLFGKYQAKISLEKAENERRLNELKDAKKMQEGMLPKVFPTSEHFEISAGLITSTEVGGDYYDFFKTDDTIYAVCGDATGHGTSAGMVVSVTKSALNGLPFSSTSDVLEKINNIIKKIKLGSLRMSLNICKIEKNLMTMSSAAMPPIYHYLAKSKKCDEIEIQGLPLGGLKNETYDSITRKIAINDVFVLLSDGLPEAENKNKELYDYERVRKVIAKNAKKSAEEIKEVMLKEVDLWLDGQLPDDDVTIVVIKRNNKK